MHYSVHTEFALENLEQKCDYLYRFTFKARSLIDDCKFHKFSRILKNSCGYVVTVVHVYEFGTVDLGLFIFNEFLLLFPLDCNEKLLTQ